MVYWKGRHFPIFVRKSVSKFWILKLYIDFVLLWNAKWFLDELLPLHKGVLLLHVGKGTTFTSSSCLCLIYNIKSAEYVHYLKDKGKTKSLAWLTFCGLISMFYCWIIVIHLSNCSLYIWLFKVDWSSCLYCDYAIFHFPQN